MQREELIEKTKQTIEALYQNREHEAVQNVTGLLPAYQEMLQELADCARTEELVKLLTEIKALLACYQAQDMLGMADVLHGQIMPLLRSTS